MGERRLLSLVTPERLRRILTRVLDEERFYSPHGVRSLSAIHRDEPVELELGGVRHSVSYQPAPIPQSRRPPDITSSDDVIFATMPGER